MKQLFFLIFSTALVNTYAQLPDTDIWLLDLHLNKDSMSVTKPENVTARKGYDNQPAFSPGGDYILYTSIRDEKQSDIFKYGLKSKQTTQFCNTPTSEYSATFMPDGKNISVVMVDMDSVQGLWKFPKEGGKAELVLKETDSIGYHCWIDERSLALVMITEPLSVATVRSTSGKFETAEQESFQLFEKSAGRCLLADQRGGFYYTTPSGNQLQVRNSKEPKKNIMSLPEGVQDYAVLRSGKRTLLFYAEGAVLHAVDIDKGKEIWQKDLSTVNIHSITRIAINKKGDKIALVSASK
jgi:hypothetical protein